MLFLNILLGPVIIDRFDYSCDFGGRNVVVFLVGPVLKCYFHGIDASNMLVSKKALLIANGEISTAAVVSRSFVWPPGFRFQLLLRALGDCGWFDFAV